MNFVNLTPHEIVIRTPEREFHFPPSGMVARVSAKEEDAVILDGIPIRKVTYGAITGLPEPNGAYYIVSGHVLSALRSKNVNREDVFGPDTGSSAIRDEGGKIIAVTGLLKL